MNKTINISNLYYTYSDGTEALKGVTFNVLEGETIGLVGPNGAGKSTLLLHLNGILRGEGLIEINAQEINGSNLDEIRRAVGVVFQDPENQLFMPTVADDVAFGPINLGYDKKKVDLLVEEALHDVDMLYAKNRISHHLSFGEKKRVAIATILSMKPNIMVLDEPTSNLDPRGRNELIETLVKFDNTKIIATHDLDMVFDICDRVIMLDKGAIVAEGKAKEILSNKVLLEKHHLVLPFCLQGSSK